MSAVRLSDCENVQEYVSKIQSYVNDFNLCADTASSTGSGTMLKSKRTYYLMKGVPKDDDWKFLSPADVRQDRHPGRQTGDDCHEDEHPKCSIPEGGRFGGGSQVLTLADKEGKM
jgi:hypothetical protein